MGVIDIPITDADGSKSLVTVQDVAFHSTTPLAGSGSAPANVFTSGVFTNENCRRVTGSVFADQAGSLQLEGSDDGVNWENLGSAVAVSASTLATFDQVLYNGLTRAVYTNTAGTAQTIFRLYGYTNPA